MLLICKNHVKEPIRLMWVILAAGRGRRTREHLLIYEAKRHQLARLVSLILRISTKLCRAITHLPHQTSGVKWRGEGELVREGQPSFLRSHFQRMAYEITAFPHGKRCDWILPPTTHKNGSEMVLSVNLIKARIKKLLEENRREYVCYHQIGRDFLGECKE